MRTKQATATINKEVDITVGSDLFLVGFEITANIDVGEMPSRDNPGEPPSVDEWVDLKIKYTHHFDNEFDISKAVLHNIYNNLFEQNILDLAEEAGMEWVDDYDEE